MDSKMGLKSKPLHINYDIHALEKKDKNCFDCVNMPFILILYDNSALSNGLPHKIGPSTMYG